MADQMDLLVAASNRQVTPQAILAYLHARYDALVLDGVTPQPVPEFYNTEQHHAQVLEALNWWPLTPPQVDMTWEATLQVALSCYMDPMESLRQPTLVAGLAKLAQRVVSALQVTGADSARPNEGRKERMRRLNRERVARWRATQKADQTPGAVRTPALSAWDEVCSVRASRAEAKQELDQMVKQTHAAFMAACDERKAALAEWDERVADALATHAAAKAAEG